LPRAPCGPFAPRDRPTPEIQQLTGTYTGLALAAQGLTAQAAAEVERTLRLAPALPLTGPVERLRDAVVAQRGRDRRFFAEVRVAIAKSDGYLTQPFGRYQTKAF
jgi:hypothetical protein